MNKGTAESEQWHEFHYKHHRGADGRPLPLLIREDNIDIIDISSKDGKTTMLHTMDGGHIAIFEKFSDATAKLRTGKDAA